MKERHEYILGEVVKAYLDTGLAIGSRTLSEMTHLKLSPASIRNTLADLEKMGLLFAPHTSAGRKPTDLGLRYFVDSLMVMDEAIETQVLSAMQYHDDVDADRLLKRASEDLSQLTKFAGMVLVPETSFSRVAKLEMVSISDEQILVVIVSESGEVQNRLVRRPSGLSDAGLREMSRRMNDLLQHCSLEEICLQLEKEVREDRLQISQMLGDLQKWAQPQGAKRVPQLLLSGQSKLFNAPEIGVIETIRSLFSAFEEKEDLLHLLEQVEKSEGVKVFIGSEHAMVDMQEVSMVFSRYTGPGKRVGALGVIGPRSMHYERVLPVVDCTARWLSQMFQHK
ncbi:MAG: heat-inducible transcription repressor HrcA [Zetaproteobacteria bacterium]|nr:heat-inducible transcription repressor HrcA [Zetaproteobacteria bacterium]